MLLVIYDTGSSVGRRYSGFIDNDLSVDRYTLFGTEIDAYM